MNQLPAGWEKTAIGEVAEINPRPSVEAPSDDTHVSFVPMAACEAETGRLDASESRQFGELRKKSYRHFEEGDVVVAKITPSMENGKAALAKNLLGGQAFGTTEFHVLRPSSRMDARYVLHFVLQPSFRGDAARQMTGTAGQLRVPAEFLRQASIPLPPLDEQQRIVDAIDEQLSRLDAGVASLQRARRNLARLRDSILRSAVQGRLVGQIPAERGVSQPIRSIMLRGDRPRPDPSTLRALPEGWAWLWLPELGELGRGKSKHRPRNDPRLYGGPYPFVQTGDVRNSGGRITSHSQTYSEEGLAQSRLWPTETVCITIAANIADSALLTYPACFPDSVVGLIANPQVALPEFIEMFIRTARSRLDAFAPATAQKNINLRILSDVAVPVPPIEEQARIVDELSRYQSIIDKAETAVEGGFHRSRGLRRSVLRDAFAGRLDPASHVA